MKLRIGYDFYQFDLFNQDDCLIMADRLEEAGRHDEARILRLGMPPCWTSKAREGTYYPKKNGIVQITIHKADCLVGTNGITLIPIHKADCLVGTISIDSGSDVSTVNCSESQNDGPSAALLILCHHLLHGTFKIEEFLHELRILLPLRQRGNTRRQVSRMQLHDKIQEILNTENA